MQTTEFVQRAIDFIEEHLDEPQTLTLERIAEAAAMSVPHLYRQFYALTGHPIKEYIRKRRASEAAVLLRGTALAAIDVGFRCGFDAHPTFVKAFKRTTGVTPGMYRRAELIYSFERISLRERVTYLEEREVSERFPDVKVIRLAPLAGGGRLYTADRADGLEEAALAHFRAQLADASADSAAIRLFGWNVTAAKTPQRFGYRLAAVRESGPWIACPGLTPVALPHGLYAMARAAAFDPPGIIEEWNRLLAEWLPRSTFELGDHGYLEEYPWWGSRAGRMKLYLPLKRRETAEAILPTERAPVRALRFRGEGRDGAARADAAAMRWLEARGCAGDSRFQAYMSCSYGIPLGDGYTHDVYLGLPLDFAIEDDDLPLLAELPGGPYACLTTGAYGAMTGVLERMFRWLNASPDYAADDSRPWYARYLLAVEPIDEAPACDAAAAAVRTNAELDRLVRVECCVPIIPIQR